jgi:hypothetical protein
MLKLVRCHFYNDYIHATIQKHAVSGLKFTAMRRILMTTFFFTLTTLATSCKKVSDSVATSIEGNWELLRVSGSRALIRYPAGNGNMLKFSASNYETYENNRLVKAGTYKIVEDASAESAVCLVLREREYTNRIIYDNDTNPPKKFMQITADTLSIIGGCFAVDAGSNTEYVRRQ